MGNVIPQDFLKNEETKYRLWDDVTFNEGGYKVYKSKYFLGYRVEVRNGYGLPQHIYTLFKDNHILAVGTGKFSAFQKLQEDTGNLMHYINIKK